MSSDTMLGQVRHEKLTGHFTVRSPEAPLNETPGHSKGKGGIS